MTNKRILLFNGNQVTAYLWHNSQLQEETSFLPHPEGLQAFASYLQQQRRSLFYWLTDTAEESFQLEEIPYVQGRDRTALIARRLKQYFYGTPLSTALTLGRSSTGRRDEKILFVALTRPETMSVWLDVIRQQETILAGIYSVSLILASIAPHWLATEKPTLLITQTASGIHESFFLDKKLQFSRLTPLNLGTVQSIKAPGIAQTIAIESVKTYQYLVGQRQLKPRTPIRVAVLLTPEQRTDVESQCKSTELLEFDFLEFDAIAKREKLKPSSHTTPQPTLDQLLMHCLVVKPPAQQFAPPVEQHAYRIWQLRLALTAVAIIALISGLLFALKTAFDTNALKQATSNAITQTVLTTQRYNALLSSLPQTNIGPDNLRALMARYESIQNNTTDLAPLLSHLSDALNNNSAIELTSLEWKVEPTLSLPPTARLIPLNKTHEIAQSNDGTATPPTAPPANHTGQSVVTLKINAQLALGLSSDLRAQKTLIEQFAQQLQNTQTQTYLLDMPFEVGSEKLLKNLQNDVNVADAPAPAFSLMLVRPLVIPK